MKLKNLRMGQGVALQTTLGTLTGLLDEESGWQASYRADLGLVEISRPKIHPNEQPVYVFPIHVGCFQLKSTIPVGQAVDRSAEAMPLSTHKTKSGKK